MTGWPAARNKYTDLVRQRKKGSADMDRVYKAFISYRHLPLEMSVAKKMHRRIERYVIPKELRKNGAKKLGYVFRDQDELPISSSLSSNIQAALDRSEYLIVICTPETRKSAWVLREITYFLETHDRDHVLAVLADGTPETAFPEPLTTVFSEEGDPLQRVEPLAANIVASSAAGRSRLFATESLRILAALIGCSYDSLYKREQRYKMRRIGAAAALVGVIAAGFIGMLLNRNREIRANYEQALRNQSLYLASEALNTLEDGDRLGAISLAMEALPSETTDRPLVSRAEYALGCAVGAYISPGNAIGLHASGVLSHAGVVSEFQLNEDKTLLCSRTADGTLTGWDTESMQNRWTFSVGTDRPVKSIAGFLSDSELVAWSEERVYCLNAESGERIWELPISDFGTKSWERISQVCIASESRDIVVSSSYTIALLDGESGAVRRTLSWPEETVGEEEVDFYTFRAGVSPNGKNLSVEFSAGPDGYGMAVIDLEDGSLRMLHAHTGNYYIADQSLFLDEDTFLYAYSDLTGGSATTILNMKTMIRSTNVLRCVDLKTGETRWESSHVSSSPAANDMLLFDKKLMDRPLVIYAYANHLDVLDAGSGEKLSETEFSSRLIGVDLFNSIIFCVTENGERGQINPKTLDTWTSTKCFITDLVYGKGYPGHFWVLPRSSGSIVHYGQVEADPAWLPMETIWAQEDDREGFNEERVYIGENCIAFLSRKDILLVNDGDPTEPLQELQLPNDPEGTWSSSYTPVYCEDKTLCLTRSGVLGPGVAYVDTETFAYRIVPWTDPTLEPLTIYSAQSGKNWAALICRTEEKDGTWLQTLSVSRLDEDLNIKSSLEIGTFSGLEHANCCYDPSGRFYLYLPDLGTCFCADLRRNSVIKCGDTLVGCMAGCLARSEDPDQCSCFSADGKQMAMKSGEKEWTVMKPDGTECFRIRSEAAEILSACFSPDRKQLLTVETDGYLHWYSGSDGRVLGKNELYYPYRLSDSTKISWTWSKSGFVGILCESVLNLVSLKDGGVFAYVPGCYGYVDGQDFCVCYDYSGSDKEYGGFRRYSLETLIDYGKSILNGWEMSEAQRMEHGLG